MATCQANVGGDIYPYLIKHSTDPKLELCILESFPYPIHIYAADGTSVFVNPAFLREFSIPSEQGIVGRYNILSDIMIDIAGIRVEVEGVFRGCPICLKDNKVPMEYISNYHHINTKDFRSMYQDITAFPLFDSEGRVEYVVVMLMTRREYNGKSEIRRAQEYIQNHSDEKFDLQLVAKAAGFSPAYFARLFRKYTHMTPHEYYVQFKIDRIKEKLLNQDISIAAAFAACGVEYNGHFARVFRLKTGMTPTQYRQQMRR